MNNNTGKGLLIYLLGVIGPLIVLFGFKDNDRKITFHAYQSLTITIANLIATVALSIVSAIPFIGFVGAIAIPVVSIFLFVLIILGIIKVCNNDQDPKLVLVGDLTEKFFGDAINKVPENVTPIVTPSFDPNTGQPITQPQPQANFDPNTGQPITQPVTETPVESTPTTDAPVEEAPVEAPAEEAPTTDAPTE